MFCVKMWQLIFFLKCLVLLSSDVESARILGVFPIPSRSHQVVFRTYMQELAKKGHELVIITPEPTLKSQDTSLFQNVTEIDVSFAYSDLMEKMYKIGPKFKRGIIQNIDEIIENDFYITFFDIVANEFNAPEVLKLINDKTQKFDLIVLEGFYDYQLIFSHIFKAPVIMFPSFMGFADHYEMLGAPGRHPILYPNLHRMNIKDLTFWDMLRELKYEIQMYRLESNLEDHQNKLLKENFGPNTPTIKELRKNVDFLFLNANPMIAGNRPIPPNVVYLGATHMKPPREIPQDLKTYLDNSKRGVIYVSFGSNIRPSMMEESLLKALLDGFAALPYDILWRFDGDELKNVPENVKWQKWFPQRDLLFHPNIKAFVTQCGLQSMDEAIDAEVPLIGIPMMAEQWYNAQKFVDFGIGVKLDIFTLTSNDLVKGVQTVAGDKSYKENIKRLRAINNDQPQTPLEKAVWWTEYILRHGGAKHLRSPMADMSWTEYYMIDFFVKLLGLISVGLVILVILLKRVSEVLLGGSKKVKRN